MKLLTLLVAVLLSVVASISADGTLVSLSLGFPMMNEYPDYGQDEPDLGTKDEEEDEEDDDDNSFDDSDGAKARIYNYDQEETMAVEGADADEDFQKWYDDYFPNEEEYTFDGARARSLDTDSDDEGEDDDEFDDDDDDDMFGFISRARALGMNEERFKRMVLGEYARAADDDEYNYDDEEEYEDDYEEEYDYGDYGDYDK